MTTLQAPNEFHDFAIFRETVDFMLGKDKLAVDLHVENSTFALFHLGFNAKILLQVRSQTGCFRKVVSLAAIFDFYFHSLLAW